MRVASAAIVWEFLISKESRLEFESIYGPGGPWAELFRQSPNYLGTELLRDLSRPGRYLTIDRWTSARPCTASNKTMPQPTPPSTHNARP